MFLCRLAQYPGIMDKFLQSLLQLSETNAKMEMERSSIQWFQQELQAKQASVTALQQLKRELKQAMSSSSEAGTNPLIDLLNSHLRGIVADRLVEADFHRLLQTCMAVRPFLQATCTASTEATWLLGVLGERHIVLGRRLR
jgi:uncharacterized protein YacL (UPF0231 family)